MTLELLQRPSQAVVYSELIHESFQAAGPKLDFTKERSVQLVMGMLAADPESREIGVVKEGSVAYGMGIILVMGTLEGVKQLWVYLVYSRKGFPSCTQTLLSYAEAWGGRHGFKRLYARAEQWSPARRRVFQDHWGFSENAVELVKEIKS